MQVLESVLKDSNTQSLLHRLFHFSIQSHESGNQIVIWPSKYCLFCKKLSKAAFAQDVKCLFSIEAAYSSGEKIITAILCTCTLHTYNARWTDTHKQDFMISSNTMVNLTVHLMAIQVRLPRMILKVVPVIFFKIFPLI